MQVLIVGGTAPTHIRPHVALVAELVTRGHAVTYVCGEPVRGLVAPTGAQLVTYPTALPTRAADDSGDWPDDGVAGMRLFLEDNLVALPHVQALDRPDVVLYETGGYAGAVAARAWGVPAAGLSPAVVAWDGYAEDMAVVQATLEASPAWADYDSTFTAWFTEHGMPRSWQDTMWYPDHGLVMIPRVMQPHADRVGPHQRFVGPCLGQDRHAETFTPAVTDRRILYVASGTAYTDRPALYRAAVTAVAGDEWHVVLATGRGVALGDLPGSVEVHERVPQLGVLAHADAFVTHAGMGSCTEALWQGVPMVAVPAAVDQFMNADTLVANGAGAHVAEADATPDALRQALDGLTPIDALPAGGAEQRWRVTRRRRRRGDQLPLRTVPRLESELRAYTSHDALPPSSDVSTVRRRARSRRSAGRAACAWAVVFALVSLYWAAGGWWVMRRSGSRSIAWHTSATRRSWPSCGQHSP